MTHAAMRARFIRMIIIYVPDVYRTFGRLNGITIWKFYSILIVKKMRLCNGILLIVGYWLPANSAMPAKCRIVDRRFILLLLLFKKQKCEKLSEGTRMRRRRKIRIRFEIAAGTYEMCRWPVGNQQMESVENEIKNRNQKQNRKSVWK